MGVCCLCACVFKLIISILNTVILFSALLIAGLGGALIGLASNGTFALILQGIIFQVLSTLNIVDKQTLDNVGNQYAELLQPAGIALLIIGGIVGGIAILGYCGTSFTILLKLYMLIIVVLVVLETILVAVFFSGALNGKIQEGINMTLVKYYVDLNDGGIYSMIWNIVMIQVHCCGLHDHTDFFYIQTNPWPHEDTIIVNGKEERHLLQIPLSCCETNGTYPYSIRFIDEYCAVNATDTNSNKNKGCWDEVSTQLNPQRQAAIVICSLIIIVQVVIALMAFIIIKDKKSAISPA